MNGRKLLERGLQLGIPLWKIEKELDWQENQASRGGDRAPCKPNGTVTENKKTVSRSHSRFREIKAGSSSEPENSVSK